MTDALVLDQHGFNELDDNELQSVDGGSVLGVLAIIGAAYVVYEVGYAVGKAIAHALN